MSLTTKDLKVMSLDEASITGLKHILNDKAFCKYRNILRKVYQFLIEASENEKRLFNEYTNAQAIIQGEKKRAEAAIALRQEDSAVIESLKKELENSWQTIDEGYEKEDKAIITITKLKKEMLDLRERNEECGDMQHLFHMNQELQKQNKYLLEKLNIYEKQFQHRNKSQHELESEKAELEKQVSKKNRLAESTKMKLQTETKGRKEDEEEIRRLKSTTELQVPKFKNLDSNGIPTVFSVTKLQRQLESRSKILEKIQKELEESKLEVKRVQDCMLNQRKEIEHLTQLNANKNEDLKKSKTETDDVRKELETLKRKLDKLTGKDANDNAFKDLAILNEKYTTLMQESKQMEEIYKSKILSLQKIIQLDKKENKTDQLLQHIEELQKLLQIKSQEKEKLDLYILNLLEEKEKQLIFIKQLEQARDYYINECGILEEKIQRLCDEKIVNLEHTNQTEIKMDASTQINNSQASTIEAVGKERQSTVALLEAEIVSLNQKLDLKQKEIHQLKATECTDEKNEHTNCAAEGLSSERQQFIVTTDHLAYNQLLSKIEALQKVHQIPELIQGNKNQNQTLMRKVDTTCKLLALFKEKLELHDEMLRRGKKQSKNQIKYINQLKRKIYSLKYGLQQNEENFLTKVKNYTTYYPDSNCETLLSGEVKEETIKENTLLFNENDIETENLKIKLKTLEKTLEERKKEITDKSECIKGQFEVIEQLRKCILSTGQDKETQALRQKIYKQEEMIQALRGKVTQYELYIRDCQDEISQLHHKVQQNSKLHTGKAPKIKESHPTFLQTRKLEVTNATKKKCRGGGYRMN